MNESHLQQAQAMAGQRGSLRPSVHVVFDGRHPKLLDHHGHVLQITAGHVDVFATRPTEANAIGARHHLFRAESGEIILPLQEAFNASEIDIRVIAVGSPGSEALLVPREDLRSFDLISTWISRLAGLMAGANPSWDMLEVASDAAADIPPGERRRGPARSIAWVSLEAGAARPMGLDPEIEAGSPLLPLTSGMWIEAGPSGCTALGSERQPDAELVWPAVDQFHLGVASCIRQYLAADAERETQRLARRSELATGRTLESFDRLSAIVVRRAGHLDMEADSASPLLAACRIVADAVRAPFVVPLPPALAGGGFADVVEIARAAGLRFAERSCGANGGRKTSAHWSPGTVRSEAPSR